ncbi:MAG: DUF1104 domain-containing protein [Campylobacterales bacterium]|nr:DUF1104 domain-containing protein [Campylobacterales bacterium]
MKILYTFLITIFLASSLIAGENFSEMSTQELIAIMGYVKNPQDKEKFKKELQSRLKGMSASEKEAYEKNLHKLK